MMKVEFYKHNIGKTEISRVNEVLKTVFLTTGRVVGEFEEKFSNYLNCKYTVGVTSCTAALHLSLLAYDIGLGDEVITTPLSFVATSNSILHAQAKPVFVDVEPDTGNIDVDLIEPAITKKTKAIMPVHLYGQMCDMKKISKIADKHGLRIIEDCAHCIEAEREGVRPAQLSDAACFSFYATKSLNCGEGGAISTNNSKIVDKLKSLRLHGMNKGAENRYTEKKYQHWDQDILGWKYNLDNIKAALLVSQIDRLDGYWRRRQEIYNLYKNGLQDLKQVKMPIIIGKSALHLFTIWVDPPKRDNILHALQRKGIGVAVNYRAIHNLRFYKKKFGFELNDFPNAQLIGSSTVSLPFYPKLTNKEIKYTIEILNKVLKST
jgi:dTDP-4-amino-4,6-dideoxygalactose transaminase